MTKIDEIHSNDDIGRDLALTDEHARAYAAAVAAAVQGYPIRRLTFRVGQQVTFLRRSVHTGDRMVTGIVTEVNSNGHARLQCPDLYTWVWPGDPSAQILAEPAGEIPTLFGGLA